MERRTFLRWAVHGLGAVFGAVIGIPAVVYLIDPRNRLARQSGLRPVGRLNDLLPRDNEPKEVVIRETRLDAWALHPDEVVGRVWLVRRPGLDDRRRPKVEAFNVTCPHLGCAINYTNDDFLCPCHGAHYTKDGTAIRQDENGRPINNPAPRNMDSLEVRLDPVPGAASDYVILVKYEKFLTNVPEKKPLT